MLGVASHNISFLTGKSNFIKDFVIFINKRLTTFGRVKIQA